MAEAAGKRLLMEIDFSAINRSSLLGALLRAPLHLLPAATVMPVLQGPLRGAKWIVGSGTHGCWLGSYEHQKGKIFQTMVPTGSVVYDIGANVGYYTLIAAFLVKSSGQVFAFEPVPRNYRFLEQHLALNHLSNVTVVKSAVSSVPGERYFDPAPGPSMGHLAEAGSLKVRCATLDDFVFKEANPAPHVIKIDVEGAEADVLAGASEVLRRNRPLIFLATHGEAVQRECRNILNGHGFIVKSVDGQPMDRADELIAGPPELMS
jgi:FkbM family methyltransferase